MPAWELWSRSGTPTRCALHSRPYCQNKSLLCCLLVNLKVLRSAAEQLPQVQCHNEMQWREAIFSWPSVAVTGNITARLDHAELAGCAGKVSGAGIIGLHNSVIPKDQCLFPLKTACGQANEGESCCSTSGRNIDSEHLHFNTEYFLLPSFPCKEHGARMWHI